MSVTLNTTHAQLVRQKKQQLCDAMAIYQWGCTPKRRRAEEYICLFSVLLFITFGSLFIIYDKKDSMLAFTFFSLFGVALALYFRHTVYEPKTYKYQLTAFGVRYTEEENIPEFMYKAVRVSAYFGIVLCLVAGLIAGPLIFIGGGAFALMAFKMTGFEKAIAHESFFWHHTYDIRIHRKSGTVNIWPRNPEGLELNCFSYYGRRTWSNPQDIDEIIAQIRALGIKVNVIEFERLRDV